MIKVVIADDHNLVRNGIVSLLSQATDIEVVGEAEDGQEAIEKVMQYHPDVLVIDIAMPTMNGILATEAVRRTGLPTEVVILSMYLSHALIKQAIKAGALGYVLKKSVISELLYAVRAASKGQQYLCSMVSIYLPADCSEDDKFNSLTTRERQILQLIANGKTNSEMAKNLSLNIKTIEKHRSSLIEKLGTREIANLVQIALKYGLISLKE